MPTSCRPAVSLVSRGSWRPTRRRAWSCPTWWWLEWASGSPSALAPRCVSSTQRPWSTCRTLTSPRLSITSWPVRHKFHFVYKKVSAMLHRISFRYFFELLASSTSVYRLSAALECQSVMWSLCVTDTETIVIEPTTSKQSSSLLIVKSNILIQTQASIGGLWCSSHDLMPSKVRLAVCLSVISWHQCRCSSRHLLLWQVCHALVLFRKLPSV